MGFFSKIFQGSVKASLAPIAIAVIPVAAVVVAGVVSAKKGNSVVQDKIRAELNLDETAYDMCKRNPRSARCANSTNTASSMNSGSFAGSSTVDNSNPNCPVESFVKEVSVEADAVWSQVQRVNSTVNVTMKSEGSTYERSSGAMPINVAQDQGCLKALQEPMAQYQMLKQKVQDSCRNNYDRENEKLVANKNLLASYKNKMRETPACDRASAALGWGRTVADAMSEVKSGSAAEISSTSKASAVK